MKKVPVKPREYGVQPSVTPRSTKSAIVKDVGPKMKHDTSNFSKGKAH